ncbi:MAG: hypothetical protein U0841_07185 [Chloroflexia bacterium]
MMPRRYAAYLVRHWVLGDGRERVEVQELSRRSLRYSSLPARPAPSSGRAPPERPDSPDDSPEGEAHDARPAEQCARPAPHLGRRGGGSAARASHARAVIGYHTAMTTNE